MTTRAVGQAGITLIGVYFGVVGVLRLANVVASFSVPPVEGETTNFIAIANTVSVVGALAVAGLCVYFAEALAQRFFPERHVDATSVTPQDLVRVGLILIGISTVAAALPGLLQFVGRAVWYAEASRQSLFVPYVERSWEQLADRLLECVVGGLLVANAQRLAARFGERRA